MFKKLTPVLVVESIERVLPLWEALGFKRTVEVPHGAALGFVALQGGATEVMYQTLESVKADEGKILEGKVALGAAAIFFEVEDLDAVMAKLPAETDIVVSRRKTFYGSIETIIRDAAGNIVTFAQFA